MTKISQILRSQTFALKKEFKKMTTTLDNIDSPVSPDDSLVVTSMLLSPEAPKSKKEKEKPAKLEIAPFVPVAEPDYTKEEATNWILSRLEESLITHNDNPNHGWEIFNKAFLGTQNFTSFNPGTANPGSVELICEFMKQVTGRESKVESENTFVDVHGRAQHTQVFSDFVLYYQTRGVLPSIAGGPNKKLPVYDEDGDEISPKKPADYSTFTLVVPNQLSICFGSMSVMLKTIQEFLRNLVPVPVRMKRTVPRGTIQLLGMNNLGQMEFIGIPEQKRSKFESGNYAPDVCSDHRRVVKEIRSKKPNGKIAIYQGPPGTGKTYAIRNLVSEISNCNVVLIPPSMTKELGSPSFITLLLNNADEELPMIFILEDGDEVLRARSEGNQSAISTLLNLGDGILGSILDTRIIVTTNLDLKSFDEAVTRSGRLIALVNFDKLSSEQARDIVRKNAPAITDAEFEGTIFNENGKIRLSDCYEFAGNFRNKLDNKRYLSEKQEAF